MQTFDNPDGATPLDPDELDGLKLKHITTRAELDRWEQENIADAMDWLSRRKKSTDMLTEDFIKTLHIKMLNKVWSWAGTFRRSGKNIGVDWPVIPIELQYLLGDVRYWIENDTYEADDIAARFHHRLVYIHLFPNGNGRHARLMADTLLTDMLNAAPFSWGDANLNKDGDVRRRYINALRAADSQNYEPLINFVRT